MKKSILLLSLIAVFGFCLTNCGGEDKPDPNDNTNSTIEEWVEIDGTKYSGDQIVSKKIVENNSESELRIYTTSGQYPIFIITHERNPDDDMLVARVYTPRGIPAYKPDFDLYGVSVHQADGPPPIDCQYYTENSSTGTYELKKNGDKFISDFSNVTANCTSGGSQTGSKTFSGYLVWENK